MKIALLADIHSNQHALSAVLNDISNSDIDLVIFLGDYIFGGPGSNEVVDLIMGFHEKEKIVIRGNIDELILPIEEKKDWIYPVSYSIYENLGNSRIQYIKSLPSERYIEVENVTIKICHDPSIRNICNLIDERKRELNTPNGEEIKRISQSLEADICLFGHYHTFIDEQVNGKRFICSGSIGLPFNGDNRAQYSVLEITGKKIEIDRCYKRYDLNNVIDDFEHAGFIENYKDWSKGIIKSLETGHCYI